MSSHTAGKVESIMEAVCLSNMPGPPTSLTRTKHVHLTAIYECIDFDEDTYKACIDSGIWNHSSIPLCECW